MKTNGLLTVDQFDGTDRCYTSILLTVHHVMILGK